MTELLLRQWIYPVAWTEAGPQLARRGTETPSGLGIYGKLAGRRRRIDVCSQPRVCDPSGKLGSRAPAGLVERSTAEVGW